MELFPKQKTIAYRILAREPEAYCIVQGSPRYSSLWGKISFYQGGKGVAVTWEFRNLPFSREGSPGKECRNAYRVRRDPPAGIKYNLDV